MRTWLSSVYWKIRGRRQVRLQFEDNKGAIDGVLLGTVAGHYRLANCLFFEHRAGAQGTEMLGETWILKEKVLLLNVKV